MTDQKRPPWAPDQSIEFTYKRGDGGDITVFANDKIDAARVIRQHGFIVVDVDAIVQTGQKLTDFLKQSNCPTCGKPK